MDGWRDGEESRVAMLSSNGEDSLLLNLLHWRQGCCFEQSGGERVRANGAH